MLAANLVQETLYATDHKPVPDSQKRLQFQTIDGQISLSNVSDKGKVFPWLREIDFQFKKDFQLKPDDISKVCLYSASPENPDTFDPSPHKSISCINKLEPKKDSPGDRPDDADNSDGPTYEFKLPRLTAGSNYALCFQEDESSGKPYCARFTTYEPFLPSDWAQDKQQEDNACHSMQMPCLVKKLANGTSVAIFGVVEQELPQNVGNLNYAWRNVHKPYKTEVEATDPVEALREELEYFKDFRGLKILLAHMPGAQAQRLAATLGGFDVVISLADPTLFTIEETVTLQVERSGEKKAPPLFTAVPRETYHANSATKEEFEVTVQTLDFTREQLADQRDKVLISTSTHTECIPPALPSTEKRQSFAGSVEDTLKGLTGQKSSAPPCQTSKECQKRFAMLVEESLRRRAHADLALIQNRDIYWANESFAQEEPLQATLERLLWKGDFLYVARIPGKTITQMLKESKSFAAADKNSVSEEHVTRRDLDCVGIHHDEDTDQYYIGGVPLDPDRLYTVATTDYVGLGDTGYPELASDDVGHPARPADLPERLERVAAIVYEGMRGITPRQASASCKSAVQLSAYHDYPECVSRDDYFDDTGSKPTDTRPGNTPGHMLKEWALSAWHQRGQTPSGLEKGVQEHPVWSLSLQKGSVTFSANRHRFSEGDQQNTFGGVPLPEVTSPRGHTWGVDQQITLMRSGKVAEWYASNQATYLVQVNRQPTAPTQTIQKNNLLSIEGGVRLHIDKTRPHAVLVLAPFHVGTQLINPITTLKVQAVGGAQPLVFQQRRSENWLPRVGGRYENRNSWFEFGYEQGPQLNAIREFDFSTSAGGLVRCVPTARQTLQGCVSANSGITPSSTVTPVYETKGRRGLYTDLQLQVPLLAQLTYTVRNQGEYFFGNPRDNSTDTLYVDRLTNSVSIPVIGNLALKPEFDMFLFENKVDQHHYWEYQTLISLDFTFDWYRGNGWLNALKYKGSRKAGSK
jgi:hypothetical protein